MRKPPADHTDICFCPLSGILDVVAKKWALLIIAILGNEGEKGFNELKKELGTISPKPLSDTLKNLERIGLVHKRILETSPPTVKYSLTPDGWEFREYLIPMLVWVSAKGGQEMPGCPIKTGEERMTPSVNRRNTHAENLFFGKYPPPAPALPRRRSGA